MTALIITGAILLLLFLLFTLRVRVVILYREKLRMQLRIFAFRFPLFPKKPPDPRDFSPKEIAKRKKKAKKKAAKKDAKKEKKQQKKQRKQQKKEKKAEIIPAGSGSRDDGLTLTEKLELIRALVAAVIVKARKHLILHAARLHISVATGDAATTAIATGAVSGAVGGILSLLSTVTAVDASPPNVAVTPNYLEENSTIDVKLVLSLRVCFAFGALFSLALAYLSVKRRQNAKKASKKS